MNVGDKVYEKYLVLIWYIMGLMYYVTHRLFKTIGWMLGIRCMKNNGLGQLVTDVMRLMHIITNGLFN